MRLNSYVFEKWALDIFFRLDNYIFPSHPHHSMCEAVYGILCSSKDTTICGGEKK